MGTRERVLSGLPLSRLIALFEAHLLIKALQLAFYAELLTVIFRGVAVMTLLSVGAQARNDMLGGGGGGMPPITSFPGQGIGPSSSTATAVGTVAGTAAQDYMRGKKGEKCRFERRQGGAIPEW